MNELGSFSLKDYNTFKIDAQCKLLQAITNEQQLIEVLGQQRPPFFILGGGSNLLISQDQDLTILKNDILGKQIVSEDEKFVYLKVGGGENWHELVLWAIANNYGGLENLSLIPGTVGASPIQNIGAYGVELDQVFHELEAIDMSSGLKKVFSKTDCEFGYRDSIFKRKLKGKYFITHVTYKLSKSNHKINISYAPLASAFTSKPSIKEVSEAVITIRQSKLPDPKEIGNSGSFFKNPIVSKIVLESIRATYPDVPSYPVDETLVKIPAGWMIDKAGWKGFRRGDAGVYDKQALVLVNHGNATGPEIWALAQEIIADIKEKFKIELSPEVNII
jgi:UDP-N-acetylmuramate dehydrogenase